MVTANSVTLPQHSHLSPPCLLCDTLAGTEESHESIQWIPLPNDNPNGGSCHAASQCWGREHLPLHILKGLPNVRMHLVTNSFFIDFFFFLTYIRFLPPLTWHSLSVEGISLSSAFICVHTHTCQQQQFLCPRVITPPLNPHISPSAEWNCYSRSLLSHTAVVSAPFFQDSALTHYYSCHFCCFIMSHSHAYLSVLYYPYISQSFTSLPPLSSDLFILDYKP